MSGRDSGRGGRSFGGGGGGFRDRDGGRGNFGGGGGGGFRDRDRGPRDAGGPPRPWERRDDDRPARPAGDRPFDRPAGPPPDRDVRVERYDDDGGRPPRPDRPPGDRPERGFGDRPGRFGGDRDSGPPPGGRFGRDSTPGPQSEMPVGRGEPRPTATPPATAPARAETPAKGAAAAAARPTPEGWTEAHLLDSWREEGRLKGWTPGDQEQREMVEDNIEADPQVPGRDGRAISVQARSGVVTLTGTVRSRAVKFAAGSDAYWTYGVNEVRNELLVKPRGPQAAGSTPAPAPASAPVSDTPVNETPTPAEETPAATATIEPVGATAEPVEGAAEVTPTPEELIAAAEATPDVIEPAPAKPKRASRKKVAAASESGDDEE